MLDYFALILVFVVALTLFYGIIVIHDIPYEIAHRRNHPHQDALHVAGWVSLFTLHVIWPFLWIWATLYREDRGWGFGGGKGQSGEGGELAEQVAALSAQVAALEARMDGPGEAAEPEPEAEPDQGPESTDQEEEE